MARVGDRVLVQDIRSHEPCTCGKVGWLSTLANYDLGTPPDQFRHDAFSNSSVPKNDNPVTHLDRNSQHALERNEGMLPLITSSFSLSSLLAAMVTSVGCVAKSVKDVSTQVFHVHRYSQPWPVRKVKAPTGIVERRIDEVVVLAKGVAGRL